MRRAHGFNEKLSIVEGPAPPQDDPADLLQCPERGYYNKALVRAQVRFPSTTQPKKWSPTWVNMI